MAIIRISKKWDETQKKYVPDKFELEGEGNIIVSHELVENADPDFLKFEGRALIFGPYVLEVLYETHEPDGDLVCRLVIDPKSQEWVRKTPWEGMDR